jgi:hypothetical protein
MGKKVLWLVAWPFLAVVGTFLAGLLAIIPVMALLTIADLLDQLINWLR